MDEKVFTMEELAQYWKVSYHTVLRMVQSKQLKSFKVGNSVRITSAEVRRFENNQST